MIVIAYCCCGCGSQMKAIPPSAPPTLRTAWYREEPFCAPTVVVHDDRAHLTPGHSPLNKAVQPSLSSLLPAPTPPLSSASTTPPATPPQRRVLGLLSDYSRMSDASVPPGNARGTLGKFSDSEPSSPSPCPSPSPPSSHSKSLGGLSELWNMRGNSGTAQQGRHDNDETEIVTDDGNENLSDSAPYDFPSGSIRYRDEEVALSLSAENVRRRQEMERAGVFCLPYPSLPSLI